MADDYKWYNESILLSNSKRYGTIIFVSLENYYSVII